MVRRIQRPLLALGSVLALCVLTGGARPAGAQSDAPAPQTAAAVPLDLHSAGSSAFLKVPLVNNIPGAVRLQPPIGNPVASDPGAKQRGMSYFNGFNCVGCHAANGGGGMGPALSNGAFKFGSEPDQLFVVISHGGPTGMPSWGAVLPEQAIWDMVAYIESISREPAPQWGHTVSPAAEMPAVQQVPAEFQQTPTPWVFTEPFG